jgi:formylglycine-generating enzyme required for sulfatase activity
MRDPTAAPRSLRARLRRVARVAPGVGIVLVGASVAAARRHGGEATCCAAPPSRAALVAPAAAAAPGAPTASSVASDHALEGMAWIPAGTFAMGSDDPDLRDARPWHDVTVQGFWIDRTEVTNEEFGRFVAATGYVTTAERPEPPRARPGSTRESIAPSGIVFAAPAAPTGALPAAPSAAWRLVPGADWRHPEGPTSSIAGRADHPVVQVSFDDASAYAAWAGKRLPTEAEWERAARGGLSKKRYPWGDERRPGGRLAANTWQGPFPSGDTAEDGFAGTAPVGSYAPNAYGLFDVAGNVWEWCADWYRPDAYGANAEVDPTGPASSFDPDEPGVAKRVTRGGSFLCSEERCHRYQVGARGKAAPDSGTSHTGFRCARSGAPPGSSP